MNIFTNTQKLLGATLITEHLVGKKESLPVLSCVLLDIQDKCIVRATNLESGIDITVPCDIKEKGVIAVPAPVFTQVLRSVRNDTLNLRTEGENLLVESQGTKTLIKTISPDEFPMIPGDGRVHGVIIPRKKIITGLQTVSYAASSSMIRPELGSVLLSLGGSEIVCVATDSFRLAEKKIPNVFTGEPTGILIPLRHVSELLYVFEKIEEENIEITVEDSQLVVSTQEVRFVSRIVDGSFPSYRDIIPKDTTSEAILLKGDFSDMLRKARIFSGTDQQVGLHLYPGRKIFTATAQSATVGEMSDSLEAAVSGADLDINFHIGYLADCLSSIESDSITLSFAGIGRPLVIRGVSDPSFLYLVMPLNR